MAHDFLKSQCHYEEMVDMDTGEIARIALETKSLSTLEFEEFEERARRVIKKWFKITVPLPNTQAAIDYAL